MFVVRVVLSHLSGFTEIVVFALVLPEEPEVIIYEDRKYIFKKHLVKTGRPLYQEVELYE